MKKCAAILLFCLPMCASAQIQEPAVAYECVTATKRWYQELPCPASVNAHTNSPVSGVTNTGTVVTGTLHQTNAVAVAQRGIGRSEVCRRGAMQGMDSYTLNKLRMQLRC